MILTQRDDALYLVSAMTLDAEPILRHFYFRIEYMEGPFDLGQEFYKSSLSGVYRTLRATATINPSAPASFIEDSPIPQPKTRKNTQVRYHRGVWQKWSNSKGWIVA